MTNRTRHFPTSQPRRSTCGNSRAVQSSRRRTEETRQKPNWDKQRTSSGRSTKKSHKVCHSWTSRKTFFYLNSFGFRKKFFSSASFSSSRRPGDALKFISLLRAPESFAGFIAERDGLVLLGKVLSLLLKRKKVPSDKFCGFFVLSSRERWGERQSFCLRESVSNFITRRNSLKNKRPSN